MAIGAPYENENIGAVYIYHGAKSGLRPKIVQRIGGEFFLPLVATKGFGISIASQDVDQNGYNGSILHILNKSLNKNLF